MSFFEKLKTDLNRSDIDHNIVIECHICSTSVPGGNQVDGLPPASSTGLGGQLAGTGQKNELLGVGG